MHISSQYFHVRAVQDKILHNNGALLPHHTGAYNILGPGNVVFAALPTIIHKKISRRLFDLNSYSYCF